MNNYKVPTAPAAVLPLTDYRLIMDTVEGKVMLAKINKLTGLPIEQRDASGDVRAAVVHYMMHNAPKGSHQDVKVGNQWYRIHVMPIAG